MTGLLAIIFSIFAIIPPMHAHGGVNLFYFRSFAEIREEEFIALGKEICSDRDRLYDAYLHEIYYLGKHRLTRKYRLIRNGLWTLLVGLCSAGISAIALHLGRGFLH